MAEQWRDIAGYDAVYQVSDQGQVRNTQTSKVLQPVRIKMGVSTSPFPPTGFSENVLFTAHLHPLFWASARALTK